MNTEPGKLPTPPQREPDADQTYRQRRVEIDHELERIHDLIARMDGQHKCAPGNWSLAGKAGHLRNALCDLLADFRP